MTLTITNRMGRPVAEFLRNKKSRLPSFFICRDKSYNGIVVEVDDDDSDDFCEALEGAGFSVDSDEIGNDASSTPRFPKVTPRIHKS